MENPIIDASKILNHTEPLQLFVITGIIAKEKWMESLRFNQELRMHDGQRSRVYEWERADEHSVKYNVRSIGAVPVRGLRWRAVKALQDEGPMSPMDPACWLTIGTYHEAVTERHIRGAMLGARQAVFSRGKYRLVFVHPALLPEPAPKPPRRRPEGFSRFHRGAVHDARALFG